MRTRRGAAVEGLELALPTCFLKRIWHRRLWGRGIGGHGGEEAAAAAMGTAVSFGRGAHEGGRWVGERAGDCTHQQRGGGSALAMWRRASAGASFCQGGGPVSTLAQAAGGEEGWCRGCGGGRGRARKKSCTSGTRRAGGVRKGLKEKENK